MNSQNVEDKRSLMTWVLDELLRQGWRQPDGNSYAVMNIVSHVLASRPRKPTNYEFAGWNDDPPATHDPVHDPTKIYPKAVSDLEECHRHSCKRKQAIQGQALGAIVSAVRRYLPPDGISKDELISAVIAAIDNPEINSELK